MTYSPPTYESLKAAIAADLRDANNKTFTEANVESYILFGMNEINRLRPLQSVETIELTETSGELDLQYTIGIEDIRRIDVWRNDKYYSQLPREGGEPNSGWEVWGTTLTLPTWAATMDVDTDELKVYGYGNRAIPSLDADVLEFDAEAETAVRLYARVRGYQALQNDRALFQQWMAQPQNNEISATQLDGIANSYQAEWERHRNRIRLLRV
jgi:hypothetical protein